MSQEKPVQDLASDQVPYRKVSIIKGLSRYCTVMLMVVVWEIAPERAVTMTAAVPWFG